MGDESIFNALLDAGANVHARGTVGGWGHQELAGGDQCGDDRIGIYDDDDADDDDGGLVTFNVEPRADLINAFIFLFL